MRKTISAILAVPVLVGGMLLGVAAPSQAQDDACTVKHTNLPASCLDVNKKQFKYVKSHVGASPYNWTQLRKRYGKSEQGYQLASAVQFSMVSITHKVAGGQTVPKLAQTIPWPSYKAKSYKKYKKTKYSVYEIYGLKTNGAVITWKYGTTRQVNENTRPESQYSKCVKYFKKHRITVECKHEIWFRVKGWFAGRTMESYLTTMYAYSHGGKCPPGMPKCV